MFSKSRYKMARALACCVLLAASHEASSAKDDDERSTSTITWAPAPNSIVNPSDNRDREAWGSYRGKFAQQWVDEQIDDPILKGAIDIHAHFGPDTYDRQWDAFDIAKSAHARGMRGLVLKSHWSESASLAYITRKYADVLGLEIFGGLVLNATVGGINPQAVRHFAEIEGRFAKVVWMPTHDAEKEVKYLQQKRPFVIVSQEGALLPSVLEVLNLIAQYKLTLATGHVYVEEMLQIVTEAKKRGINRIIVTHPGLGPMFTDPNINQLKQATALGAYAEIVAAELVTESLRADVIAVIKAIGPAHCIVASDSGLVGSRGHTDSLVLAARVLRDAGFSEDDLDLMFKVNPAKVLGLPTS